MIKKGVEILEDSEQRKRELGRIYKLSDRGYGFITHHGESIFFHSSGVIGGTFEDLAVKTLVEYTRQKAERGLQAIKIIVVEDVW